MKLWGGEISSMSHGMLDDKRLVHDAIRSCSNNMPYSTETPFSDLLEQVEACRKWMRFSWDWSTCDPREHCTVSSVDPAHCGCVEVPCLTPICE